MHSYRDWNGCEARTGAAGERARARASSIPPRRYLPRRVRAAVTLRSIAAAGVNVAAVNYYFGSKERLFEEMFLRRIVPLNNERLARLAACTDAADGTPMLEDIVTAYVMPALLLAETANPNARAIVVQDLLGSGLPCPK